MSDIPTFLFEPILPHRQSKLPEFDFVPLAPVQQPKKENKAKISKSPNGYITLTSDRPENAGITEQIDIADIVHMERATAYCVPSGDAIRLNKGNLQHGEDSAAVVFINDTYLLVVADGASTSYMGEFAAKGSTTAVAEQPSTDLYTNLVTAENALTHLDLPAPNTGTSLVDEVLRQKLSKQGSETTFNQLTIEASTGRVNGLIVGDGGLTVIRTDGRREHFNFAESQINAGQVTSRLSTKDGFSGNARSLRDIVGSDIVLIDGDTVFLYSDGLQHKFDDKLIIDEVCDMITSERNPDQALAKYLGEASKRGHQDDDKTLLRYTHSTTTKSL